MVTAKRLPAAPSFRWTGWLALIWLMGAGLMLIRTVVKVAGAGHLRRSCRPLNDPRIETLLAEARQAVGLARQVRVGVTNRLTSPAVVGVFVPMLVLPLSLLSTLTPEQIRFVLLHELAHIRRGDYLANLFQFFAESLLFFNPAVWWISHQMRREREACCDALATALSGAPADYARTLVHVAENVLQQTPAVAPAFGNQRDSSSLLERIHRLLVPGYRPSLRLTWRAMLAGLTLGSALLILSAVGTRTTVAAILSSEKPATTVSQVTNQMSLQTPVQTNGISSNLLELRELSTNLDFSYVTGTTNAESLSNLVNDRILGKPDKTTTYSTYFISGKLDGRAAYAFRAAAQRLSGRVSTNRFNIKDKLEVIHLDHVSYDSIPLSEILLDLYKNSKQFDPDKIGINFIADDAVTNTSIMIHPDMNDVSLKEVLEAIVKGSAKPIRYSIQDYAVVFQPETTALALEMRIFKIKPDIFFPNLRKQTGLFVTNSVERETVALLKLFADAGVEFQPPKSLVLNPKGAVLVQATPDDLATVESIIGKLNYSLPQVSIRSRFIELPESLAQSLMKEFSPATNHIDLGSFSLVLTPTQVKYLLDRCNQDPGVNILGMPDVVTISGRQAEVQVVDVMTIVKGLKPEALTLPGVTNQVFYLTETLRLGPTLNLIPRVGADERTIQLSAVPSVTEFLGYDGPTNSVPVYLKGKKRVAATIPIPRPHFRTREMAVSVTMTDNQTLLLGGAPWVESVTSTNGIVETKIAENTTRKQLFVLVTPVLIDPVGNRIHTGAETTEFSAAKFKSP